MARRATLASPPFARPARPIFASRWAAVACAAALACGDPEARLPELDPSSERVLASGRIVGFTSGDGAHVWRGVPFAQPPVGALRWRAPLPPAPWEGVRDARRFGAACPQFEPSFRRGGSQEVAGSEDCLVANVFAPRLEPGALPTGAARMPVMVWIHGGGNSLGSADLYDFGRFARSQNVVVVAVHYRLGVLGWFHHPALHSAVAGGASPEDRSGNYGTLDLLRALEWVRENAPALGGDPGRVTVFGESAGGQNVYSLLVSPRARGLFHRAIVQSGGLGTHSVAEAENAADDAQHPGHRYSSTEVLLVLLERRGAKDREAAKRELAALGDREIESLLRGARVEELLACFEASGLGGMYRGPFLVRDGSVLPEEEPLAALAAGRYHRIPAIVGSNRDENKLFMLFGDDAVARAFGLPLWISDERRYELLADYQSRMWKARAVDEPAAAMSAWSPVFAYRFDWDEQPRVLFADLGRMLGASHAMELFFVLGRLDLGWGNRLLVSEERRPAAQRLSEAMMSYWGELARAGAPARGRAGDLPFWRAWETADPQFLVLDTEEGGGIRMTQGALTAEALIAEVGSDPRFASERERCEVLASYVRWSDALSRERYAELDGGACREFDFADPEAAGD